MGFGFALARRLATFSVASSSVDVTTNTAPPLDQWRGQVVRCTIVRPLTLEYSELSMLRGSMIPVVPNSNCMGHPFSLLMYPTIMGAWLLNENRARAL